ncbi:MAG: glycogen/starch synthase [Myxococcota bacterium]
MRIAHVAAEHSDLAYTGGLGEVVAGLPEAQARLGHDVTVVVPGSAGALARHPSAPVAYEVRVPLPWGAATFRAHVTELRGARLVMLAEQALFGRPGMYGDREEAYSDNPVRFSAFARAAARVVEASDIVHLHDWHAGLVAPLVVLGHPAPEHRPRVVFTVHNLAFQGSFPTSGAALTGLPESAFQVEGVLHHGRISPLKAGLQYADKLTTVSPTYARELQTVALGWDFVGLFRHRAADLEVIVNGLVDAERPLPTEPRAARRQAFCERIGLDVPSGPLAVMVSRLTQQKGVDLVLDALPGALAAGYAVAVIGVGAPDLVGALRAAERRHPRRVVLRDAFEPELASAAFAAADVVLVPSRFEPCGLTQLHAMRHGALPVVRRTGGLADTVRDVGDGEGWGFVMQGDDLGEALARAAALFADPAATEAARARAMAQPIGWQEPARRYLELYERTLAGRR